MKYDNIDVKKYQIIKHIINKYAENHDNVTPNMAYDKEAQILDISGISKPINFHTSSIGILPEGAYEVVGQVIRSKTDDGHVDMNGMNVYDSAQRIFNIANTNRQQVFNFISENSKSSYCSCCGTNRERSKLFYIRRVDANDKMYQVGSRCIKEHFDTSYFDLMKELSNVIENNRLADYKLADYNLIDYLTLYCMFIKDTGNIKLCSTKVISVLDSSTDLSSEEFNAQKAKNIDKIIKIANFYRDYPNYARDDNMFAIKTVQSMAEMLQDNIDIDPYYSKSNCLKVTKMYIALLSDYASDYRKYTSDLFKYNAYLVETELTNLWKEHNHTPYYLSFELDRRASNISYRVCIPNECFKIAASSDFKNTKVIVPLDEEGKMIDENEARFKLISLVSRINNYDNSSSRNKLKHMKKTLDDYRTECLSRYSHFKPTIISEVKNSSVMFFDCANVPLAISLDENEELAKSKLSTFINMSYVRQNINEAYKEFSKKYLGNKQMAYTQSKQLNLQFSCDYAEKQLAANWPKDRAVPDTYSHIDSTNKNVVVYFDNSKSYLTLPVNAIGTISGADHDISVRIQTFIAEELGLPMPKVRKERTPKTEEEKLKNRPKKNVTRLFSSAGVSASNLVSMRKVNVLNDISGNTLGVSAKGLGKILFSIDHGEAICDNDIYRGRITLDGHTISDAKTFDKKTFIKAVHALEYLVYLSDDSDKMMFNIDITTTKSGTNYTYKYNVAFGNCTGTLQFRIVQSNDRFTLKYTPKLMIEKNVDGDTISLAIRPNFSETCWRDIKQGTLKLGDIQRGSGIINGQRNNNLISGTMWINNGEPQQITNDVFTKVTGIAL